MNDDDVRAALRRHWEASDANDFVAEHEIYADHAVLDYSQSGERIRGRQRIQAARMAQPNQKRFSVRRMLGGRGLWISEFVLATARCATSARAVCSRSPRSTAMPRA